MTNEEYQGLLDQADDMNKDFKKMIDCFTENPDNENREPLSIEDIRNLFK